MAVFHPTLDRIRQFIPPPEPGELALLTFLAEHLDNTYEIFFQPMLNGDKPDLAILKRDVGVAIVEVKDWNLSGYKMLDDSHWQLRTNGSLVLSPISQVERYKKDLINLYVPELCAEVALNTRLYGIVSTAVYFHEASSTELSGFFQTRRPKYTKLIGRDSLSSEGLEHVMNCLRLAGTSPLFDGGLYDRFRRFLAPPTHTAEQGVPLAYTAEQLKLILSSAEEKKILGVAGSGKTYVLAKRAVNAFMRTRFPVLILTFNITLRNYIHDRISEVREQFEWEHFCITNYHCFLATQANRYELPHSVPDGTDEELSCFDDEAFLDPVADRVQRYQSIFIDEVQDYKIEWLRIIRKYFLAPGGEYVLVGDEKQNVYGGTLEDKKIRTNIESGATD